EHGISPAGDLLAEITRRKTPVRPDAQDGRRPALSLKEHRVSGEIPGYPAVRFVTFQVFRPAEHLAARPGPSPRVLRMGRPDVPPRRRHGVVYNRDQQNGSDVTGQGLPMAALLSVKPKGRKCHHASERDREDSREIAAMQAAQVFR